ncbi:germin-like protein 5-1 isoform X10 [Rhododendron vialii]|uniref:germin-like protein 5-1 isoform X10 n=1 Tax=Rhododendron vialii TaxID=182163 RepID=UPI00265E4FA4|nr:germin-like protein 5-1 isoform X10 [Rhododendron vialii]
MVAPGKLYVVVVMVLIATISNSVSADPDMLQDVCVADLNNAVKMNGFACKASFSASDFFFAGLSKQQPTNNTLGSIVTQAFVTEVPGLNTLGVAMARIDFAPGGLNQPHEHPRATEVLFVLYGELDAGFITTANVLVSKTIKQGEIFIFPRGLVHFQINNGKGPAAAIAGFNSQNPGREDIATSLFAATPPVPDSVLSKAFQISNQEVDAIKSKLAGTS